MDESIFSLFTTKDWPFELSGMTREHDRSQDQSSHSRQPKNVDSGGVGNRPTATHSLRSRAESLDGLLFIDRLMILGSIKDHSAIFPPSHPSRLRHLLDSIDGCLFDLLKKNCLVYYLLKEYGDGREVQFGIDSHIPSHFRRGLDGLWALDHSDWKLAWGVTDYIGSGGGVSWLCDPCPILESPLISFLKSSVPLPPSHLVIRAMCLNHRIQSAWTLQRSFDPPDRERLLQTIFDTCFGLNDFQVPLADSLQILLGFPFDELEDSVMARFAVKAPQLLAESHAVVAVHFYLNRLTAEARFVDAIRFERELSETTRLGPDPDVERVTKGINDILPEIQRSMIELELDPPVSRPTSLEAPAMVEANMDNPVGQEAGGDMDTEPRYDLCSLAWDTPASPPELPPPSSLAEVRDQQQLINESKLIPPKNSLPLSASPIFRRHLPRTCLDKPNESQKNLLKALVHHSQARSVSDSPLPVPGSLAISQSPSKSEERIRASPTPQTSRSMPFVGLKRTPSSALKPFSNSLADQPRSSLPASGSPFHRLDFSSPNKPPPPTTTEERWPTRVVFTPRRPSPQNLERKPSARVSRNPPAKREASHSLGHRSGEEVPLARPTPKKKYFEGVVIPRQDPRKLKTAAKQGGTVDRAPEIKPAAESHKMLPGGLGTDEDMGDVTPEPSEPTQPQRERGKARPTRKKAKVDDGGGGGREASNSQAPITPRRSSRLNTNATSARLTRGAAAAGTGGIAEEEADTGSDGVDGENDRDSIDLLRRTPSKGHRTKKRSGVTR